MARQKTKTIKFNVALNELEADMLAEMMKDDAKTEKSSYIGFLISEIYKERGDRKNKRGPGRPPKEEDPQDSNLYPHPTNPSLHVTKDEWEAYYEYNNLPIPDKMPAPIEK